MTTDPAIREHVSELTLAQISELLRGWRFSARFTERGFTIGLESLDGRHSLIASNVRLFEALIDVITTAATTRAIILPPTPPTIED